MKDCRLTVGCSVPLLTLGERKKERVSGLWNLPPAVVTIEYGRAYLTRVKKRNISTISSTVVQRKKIKGLSNCSQQ